MVDVEDADAGEDEEDRDGGDGGGFPPLPFELFSSSLLLSKDPSPALSTVNKSNMILTII